MSIRNETENEENIHVQQLLDESDYLQEIADDYLERDAQKADIEYIDYIVKDFVQHIKRFNEVTCINNMIGDYVEDRKKLMLGVTLDLGSDFEEPLDLCIAIGDYFFVTSLVQIAEKVTELKSEDWLYLLPLDIEENFIKVKKEVKFLEKVSFDLSRPKTGNDEYETD